MKKSLVILAVLILAVSSVFAGQWMVGVKSGYANTGYAYEEEDEEEATKRLTSCAEVALTADYAISEKTGCTFEVGFENTFSKNRRNSDASTFMEKRTSGFRFFAFTGFSYYTAWNKANFAFSAGPALKVDLTKSKHRGETEATRKVILSLGLDVCASYDLTERTSVFVGNRVDLDLINTAFKKGVKGVYGGFSAYMGLDYAL